MIATSKEDKHGATILTLAYTGTTEDAKKASERSRIFSGQAEGDFESTIRDHTGSGVEHLPEKSSLVDVFPLLRFCIHNPLRNVHLPCGNRKSISILQGSYLSNVSRFLVICSRRESHLVPMLRCSCKD